MFLLCHYPVTLTVVCLAYSFCCFFRTLAICALIELLNFKNEGSTCREQAAFADLVVKCLIKQTKALNASSQVRNYLDVPKQPYRKRCWKAL